MLSQSDPLPKLLQEIKLGRVRPTDAGLRAITESWLETYARVLEGAAAWRLDRTSLVRVDPLPRLELLEAAGVAGNDHPAVVRLRQLYQDLLTQIPERSVVKPT